MDDFQPFLIVVEPSLVAVDSDRHHNFVEHRQCTFQYVEMSCRERVERAGEQCLAGRMLFRVHIHSLVLEYYVVVRECVILEYVVCECFAVAVPDAK